MSARCDIVLQIRGQDPEKDALLVPQAQKTKRAIVRDTFTPPRIGVLSWAFAALFMGTIGVASYQFGGRHFDPGTVSAANPVALPLPDQDDVETTASISANIPVAVLPTPADSPQDPVPSVEQSQIEVLQREVAGLRRRLTALSEQNLAYSRRIAALEEDIARAKLSKAGKQVGEAELAPAEGHVPRPGVIVTKPAADPAEAKRETGDPPDIPRVAAPQAEAPETPSRQENEGPDTAASVPARQIDIYRQMPPPATVPAPEVNARDPVRIISPAARESMPLETGSIPPDADRTPDSFDATPTRSTLAPKVLTPSGPSGQIRGGSESLIKRSDFGAVIGHYRTSAGAAKAWADFKDQNEERMRDLRPLIMQRPAPESGVALMIGPFANAADAAVACLHLLDMTEVCRPALYAGDPLVTAAEFRDTAF